MSSFEEMQYYPRQSVKQKYQQYKVSSCPGVVATPLMPTLEAKGELLSLQS